MTDVTSHRSGDPRVYRDELDSRLAEPIGLVARSNQGLVQKFRVERVDPESQKRHEDCATFVLEPKHDPYARAALLAYADACAATLPALAADLRRWIAVENRADR